MSKLNSPQQGSAVQTLLIVLAAIAIAAAAIASYLHFAAKPVVPTGQVEQVWVYPIHHESTVGGGKAGMVGVKQPFDQIIVLAKVKVDNPSKIPIYLRDINSVLTLPQNQSVSSAAAGASDFGKVFIAYPETAAQKQAPLLRESTIAPGASGEGLLVFSYSMTKQQWDSRESLDVIISFVHQADLTLRAPK